MKFVIDLPQRGIRIPDLEVELIFAGNDAFFYLQLIALIAEQMKKKSFKPDIQPYIPIYEIEKEAWRLNEFKNKPFRSTKSMTTSIYQTWLRRLDPADDQNKDNHSIYEFKFSGKREDRTKAQVEIKKLFIKNNMGAEKAAYGINIAPEDIEIISQPSSICRASGEDSIANTLEGLSESKIVEKFIDRLECITDPQFYSDVLTKSSKAISQMISDTSLWRKAKDGSFAGSLEDYSEVYLRALGLNAFSDDIIITEWLKELNYDQWWIIESIYDTSRSSVDEDAAFDSCKFIAEFALDQGDPLSMLYIFHSAYRAHIVALKRDRLISDINHQSSSVKKEIWKSWIKLFPKGDENEWPKVASNMIGAFRALQQLRRVRIRFSLTEFVKPAE